MPSVKAEPSSSRAFPSLCRMPTQALGFEAAPCTQAHPSSESWSQSCGPRPPAVPAGLCVNPASTQQGFLVCGWNSVPCSWLNSLSRQGSPGQPGAEAEGNGRGVQDRSHSLMPLYKQKAPARACHSRFDFMTFPMRTPFPGSESRGVEFFYPI